MSINGSGERAPGVSSGTTRPGFGRLRATALIALLAGAVGSFGLMLYSGRHAPWILIVLFTGWVLSPFVALALASAVSKHWPVLTRATLYGVMLIVAVGSLAIYAADALRPPRPQAAFVFVAVPPVSWLLIAIGIAAAGIVSRSRSRRHGGV